MLRQWTRKTRLATRCAKKKMMVEKRNYGGKINRDDSYQNLDLKNFFVENESMVTLRRNEKIVFVFLEGLYCTGKMEILNRLEKLGYATVRNTYSEIAFKNNGEIDPVSEINTKEFVSDLTKQLDVFNADENLNVKENIIFFHRSYLSNYIFNEDQSAFDLYEKYKNNSIIVLCEATQDWGIMTRLQKKEGKLYFNGDEEKRKILEKLYAQNEQPYIDRYEKLQQRGIITQVLPTISTKQATANLLTLCGIEALPKMPVN